VLSLNDGAREVVYLGIAALSVLVLAIFWSGHEFATPAPGPEAGQTSARAMDRLAWAMGLLLFLYVGAEFGLGSWVASYSERGFGAGIFTGALVTSGYWGALMLGRLLSGRLFALDVPPRRVLLWSIVAGLLSSSLIASANGVFAIAVAAAFASGLAFGPIWPAAMSIAARDRGGNGPAAMVTIGNAGGFAFPWLQGRLLVSAGASTGIAMTAVLCALMLAVLVASRRLHPARANEDRPPFR
jgi:fucose permease